MNFENVRNIFYEHVPRRFHRFCRHFFVQLVCLQFEMRTAYLFDLFPFTIDQIRRLLTDLSEEIDFPSLILKCSINDILIVNRRSFSRFTDESQRLVLLVDLETMSVHSQHEILDQVNKNFLHFFYRLEFN